MSRSSVQTTVFRHEGVTLCRFRCPAGHDRWSRENRIVDGHNVAFAELPVEILPAGRPGQLVDSNLAVYYNQGDPYRRRLCHPRGDAANIFLFDSSHLLSALAPYEPDTDPERPLTRHFGSVRPETYLKQRLLLARVAGIRTIDRDRVVEAALEILDEVFAATYGEPRAIVPSTRTDASRQRERVEAVKRLLFERQSEPVSLRTLAAAVDTSVYHLCRIFRRHTGQTIHGYLQRLRLRAGLVLLETETPLAQLALQIGYAHQSHFTEAFRREFGLPPGALRRKLRGARHPVVPSSGRASRPGNRSGPSRRPRRV